MAKTAPKSKKAAGAKAPAATSSKSKGVDKGKDLKLLDAEAMLTKKYGENAFLRGDEVLETVRTSYGSFALDYITGGGIIHGRVTEISGEESSAKTSLALCCAREAIKAGKKAYLIDVENSWDDSARLWAIRLGVDVAKLVVIKATSGEQALGSMRAIVESGEECLIILDSWAAITCSAEIEASTGESCIGVNARLCNQAIRQVQTGLNLPHAKAAVLIINQLRAAMGGGGNKFTGPRSITPGGWALKFSAGVRIRVKRLSWQNQTQKGEAITIGQEVSFRTVKNKTYPPYKELDSLFYVLPNKYGQPGFDDIRVMIHLGLMWGLVKNLKEDKILKIEGGLHYIDAAGEFVRIGKDENQAVFQLNKEANEELKKDFEYIIRAAANARMRSQQGILDFAGEPTEEDEVEDEETAESAEPDSLA